MNADTPSARWMERYRITPTDVPNNGIVFVDHEEQGRSGHLGHALVEYAPGHLLAFYPNCTGDDEYKGHSGNGWMEYKHSTDGGETWSRPLIEPHSRTLYEKHVGRSLMCEKAVLAANGNIVLFYVTCDLVTGGPIWEPYFEPGYALVRDGGGTWGDLRQLVNERGRVFDARYHDGKIYVLFYANPELPEIARRREYEYQILVSDDHGETFGKYCVVPFPSTVDCGYGTMEFLKDGRLIVYVYDFKDEHNGKYIISPNAGESWDEPHRAFFKNKLRNGQMARLSGEYFMHGRSGMYGQDAGHLIIYHSEDGVHWDDGTYLNKKVEGHGAYSNNLTVGGRFPGTKQRLLIQSSHAYRDNRTNILMWWIDPL